MRFRRERGDGAYGLGLPVHVHHHRPEGCDRLTQLLFSHGCGRIHKVLQRSVIEPAEIFRCQQHVDHRWRKEQDLYALLFYRSQDQSRVRSVKQHMGGSRVGQRKDERAGEVRHRCHHQMPLGFVHAHGQEHVHTRDVIRQMRVHDALGRTSCTAGRIERPWRQRIVSNVVRDAAFRCYPRLHRGQAGILAVEAAPGLEARQLRLHACCEFRYVAVIHHGRRTVLPQDGSVHGGAVADVHRHQHQASPPEAVHEHQAAPVVRRQKGHARAGLDAHCLRARGNAVRKRNRLGVGDGPRSLQHEDGLGHCVRSPVQGVHSPHVRVSRKGTLNPSTRAGMWRWQGTRSTTRAAPLPSPGRE